MDLNRRSTRVVMVVEGFLLAAIVVFFLLRPQDDRYFWVAITSFGLVNVALKLGLALRQRGLRR